MEVSFWEYYQAVCEGLSIELQEEYELEIEDCWDITDPLPSFLIKVFYARVGDVEYGLILTERFIRLYQPPIALWKEFTSTCTVEDIAESLEWDIEDEHFGKEEKRRIDRIRRWIKYIP